MECFIVEQEFVNRERGELVLVGDEARHAIRSLRLRIGEELFATDLSGICYKSRLESLEEQQRNTYTATCSILEMLPNHNEAERDVWLVQGILQQHSKFEEVIEKATEFGVKAIYPVSTERTERSTIQRERAERILRAATKQVSRSTCPILSEVNSVEIALENASVDGRDIIVCHESSNITMSFDRVVKAAASSIAIVIGPEGGFSENEIDHFRSRYNASIASLGKRRLRAETAAIAACAIALV